MHGTTINNIIEVISLWYCYSRESCIPTVLFVDTFRLITCINSGISVTLKDTVHFLCKQAFTAECFVSGFLGTYVTWN
jgi:hypothetical protein